MAIILNPNAKQIITTAYIKVGEIALQVSRNTKRGKDKGNSHKTLLNKGFLMRKMLKVLLNHVEFDSNSGEIVALYRLTETQLNKILNCLVKVGDIQDYPAAPTLLFQGKPIIKVGGATGATGTSGAAGSDANIDVESDPLYDNITVTEVAAVGATPKTYKIGYNPYIAPTINLTITGTKIYEIGASIASKDFQVQTTKGKGDITAITLDDGGLDASLQGILNLLVVNGAGQPVTNTVSKTAITTNITVIATVTDGLTPSTDSDSINFYYPYLYGGSGTILTGANIYSSLSGKSISAKSDKTVNLNGTDQYFYFGFVDTYTSIDKIFDGSGFRVEGDWEEVLLDVDSTGLTTNWVAIGYKFYKTLIKTTINNQSYKFEHA
jgi:hypothetical protein